MPDFVHLAGIPEDAAVVDFHIHSNASDGSDHPTELIRRAFAVGLRAVALTDHDTLAGLPAARAEAERLGMVFIDGIEVSSVHEGRLVHILGHFIDPESPGLRRLTTHYMQDRKTRMDRIIKRLREVGVPIDADDFLRAYGSASSIGRGQLGAYLVEKRLIRSQKEAFDRYIGENGPAYVALDMVPPAEAVRLIVAAGGVATYAHPVLSGVDEIIPGLAKAGLVGIEVDHPAQDEQTQRHYRALAERHNLLCMGGSDCHGGRPGPERLGTRSQPLSLLYQLASRRRTPY